MGMALWPMERKQPNPTLHSLLLSFVWNPVMPGGSEERFCCKRKMAPNSEFPRSLIQSMDKLN